MLTVSELAKRSSVSPETVRHYVRVGLLSAQRDPGNGYKLFGEADVRRIAFIRQAKTLGYTLAEIGAILHDCERGQSPCKRVRELIERRIAENQKRLDDLTALQRRMETALAQWKSMPDGAPSAETLCHLIESINK